MKPLSIVLGAALLVGCGGGLHPDTVREKKLSELTDDQIKGLCIHNVETYRAKLPRSSWGTQHCVMATVAIAMVKAKESTTPLAELCAIETAQCIGLSGSAEHDMDPPEACQHVELDKAHSCAAPVSLVQECLAERNEHMPTVIADFKNNTICTAPVPLAKTSVMEGPACQKLLAVCSESGLTLPKHVF